MKNKKFSVAIDCIRGVSKNLALEIFLRSSRLFGIIIGISMCIALASFGFSSIFALAIIAVAVVLLSFLVEKMK